MVKEKNSLANNMLNFFGNLNAENLFITTNIEDAQEFQMSKLIFENQLFLQCNRDIISAILFCHKNNLSFNQEFNLKIVYYSV